MDDYQFSVFIGRNGNGWTAVCPEFRECEAHGESYEEALSNIRNAVQLRIEDGLGDDEDIPQAEVVNFTMVRLAGP